MRRTGTKPGHTPILRGSGGEEEPVKVTEKKQPEMSEETRRTGSWNPTEDSKLKRSDS